MAEEQRPLGTGQDDDENIIPIDMQKAVAAAARLKIIEGYWWVERTIGKKGVPEHEWGRIQVTPFVTPPMYPSLELRLTINLGDYESASIKVGCSRPCYPAEVLDAYDWIDDIITQKLISQRNSVLKRLGRDIPDATE